MNDKKFNQLLWEFHRDLKQLHNFKEDTVKTYISCIQKYERFAKEKWHIDVLQTTEEHLFEFMLELRKNLSPGRITHFRAALRRFFRMLQLHWEIEHNPAKNLLPVKRKKPTRYNHIPADIMLSLLRAIDDGYENETDFRNERKSRDKLMILLLWCLGLRSGELRAIKKEDIKIIDQDKKTALLTVHGKGAKERALMIMDKLFDKIVEYIQPFNESELIFPGKNNKLMDDSTINKRLKKYASVAGIKTPITAHCLRHSFATEMYYANVPLEAIRVMMGHENLRETSVYIHVSRQDMCASLNVLSIGGKNGY